MSFLRDFLEGTAETVPQGIQNYATVKGLKQRDQQIQSQEKQSFITGAELKRQLGLMGVDLTGTDFKDDEQLPFNQVRETIDYLQRINTQKQEIRPYTMPLNKRDPITGEDLFFDTRTREILRASQLPGGAGLNKGSLVPSLKTLPAGDTTELGDIKSLEELLDKIESQFETGEKEGKSLVGRRAVVEGAKMHPLVKKGASLLDIDSLQNDPLAGEFLRNNQALRTLRSFSLGGKQLTPTEVEQLFRLMPNPDSEKEDYRAQILRFREEMQRIRKNRQQALNTGYQTPNLGGVPPTPSQDNDPLGLGL